MLKKRIIPCLDVKDGKVVKGVNFVGLKEVGDPVQLAREYYEQGADELVFLDITATYENRDTLKDMVRNVAKQIYMPFCVGGGIKTIEDIKEILRCGADKVAINSAGIYNKQLIYEGARIFGNQCIVLAVDVKKNEDNIYEVFTHGGRVNTHINAFEWIKEAVDLGAGEILLTSMDKDGTKSGFDIELLKAVSKLVQVPIIASGGCGTLEHFKDALQDEVADAALAASLFHFNELSVKEVKEYLKEEGVAVR